MEQDEYLQSIGHIVVNFSGLEFAIAWLIWLLMAEGAQNNDDRSQFSDRFSIGQIITAELSFTNSLALLSSLYKRKKRSQQALDEFESMIKKADKAQQDRNIIMHSSWMYAPQEADYLIRFKMTAKRSKGFQQNSERITIERLHETINQIYQATENVWRFIERHGLSPI